MKPKRFLTTLTAAAMSAALLFGCSSDSGSSAADASADEPVTITIMHYMGEQSKRDALDDIIQAFETEYPNIKVRIEQVDPSDFYTVYQTRINTGDAPDIFFGSPREMTEYCEAGLFMDLTGADFLENIYDEVLEETTVNDKYYGVPIDVQIKGVFYNKRMFAEHELEVPTTQDAFNAVIDTFVQDGISPFIHDYGFTWGPYHELDAVLVPLCAAKGNGDLLMDSQNGVADLSSNPVAQEAAAIWNTLCAHKEREDLTMDQPTAIEHFAAGERPMFLDGGWIYADLTAASDDEFGFFALPWSNEPDENKLEVALDDCFIVSNSTEHKDEVFDFLTFMTSEQAANMWMSNAVLLSSSKLAKVDGMDPYVQEIMNYVESGSIAAKALVPDYTAAYSDAQINAMQTYIVNDYDDPAELLRLIDEEVALINK